MSSASDGPAGESFEDVAADVVEPSPTPESAAEVPPAGDGDEETPVGIGAAAEVPAESLSFRDRAAGWWRRWFGSPRKLTEEQRQRYTFRVEERWAREFVKYCFVPFGSQNPAWLLDDAEAGTATPEMRAFLQKLADRYMPQVFSYVKEEHSEAVDLAVAMGALFWAKYQVVAMSTAEIAEDVRAASAPAGTDDDGSDDDEADEADESDA